MSEFVMTNQASPGAVGANMSAFFFDLIGRPAYVGNDAAVHVLMTAAANGDVEVTGNFIVGSNVSVTTGNATINESSGRVIAGVGDTALVVTNNRVTAASLVFAQASANDSTGRVTAVTPGSGEFTISLVAPAANMPIDFLVVTPA